MPRALPFSLLLAALLTIAPASVAAPEIGGAVRLIVAGVVDGRAEAGLEIALKPGWKTYWRMPGDAGIPPTVDAKGSRGLARLEVRYPAPRRFAEGELTGVGYTETVVLPLDLAASDPAKPIDLDLDVAIGLCHDICVPLDARVAGRIDPAAPVDEAARATIAAARARLPEAHVAGRAPEIAALRREIETAGEAIEVEVAWPEGAGERDVLVEGPTPEWALPLPEKIGDAKGHEVWRFAIDGVPKGATIAGARLMFTLRAGGRAVEQAMTVEAGGQGK